jgi:hypothetical protein
MHCFCNQFLQTSALARRHIIAIYGGDGAFDSGSGGASCAVAATNR